MSTGNSKIMVYKKIIQQSNESYKYRNPFYADSISVQSENIIAYRNENINNKGTNSNLGYKTFIACSILSTICILVSIILKHMHFMNLIPIYILGFINIILCIISIAYNAKSLQLKNRTLAYYLVNENDTNTVNPQVIAAIEKHLPDVKNKIFLGVNCLFILITIILLLKK
jgi:hypothetical protein